MPMYDSHKAYAKNSILPRDPEISVEELAFRVYIPLGEAIVILHEIREDKNGAAKLGEEGEL